MQLEALELPLKTIDAGWKAGLAAAAAGVAALVAGMGLAIKATFKWAEELDSIQDIMGVTNKTAAALNFTLRKSGTSTEALTRGMTILSKGLIKADGSLDVTGKALKAWGINVLDANGMLKDQTTLIDDIAQKYGTFATQQEKVNFLTETFGRSGAELIDFFDTLAAEGGIDTVAEKVERLGLAIDPNRYEQFNRNLEELKLVGLGLAVGFTEKVMPAIEGFLELISDPKSIKPGKILDWADTTIGVFLKGLGDSVNKWVSGGGPEKLTEKVVGWIEGLGENETLKSKALIGAQHLVSAIADALGQIDWSAIADAIDKKTAESIGAHDWQASGDALGDAIEGFFTGKTAELPAIPSDWLLKLALPGVYGLRTFFETFPQSETGQAVSNAVSGFFTGLVGPQNLAAWSSLGPRLSTIVQTAMTSVKAAMDAKLSEWRTAIETKLGDISKTFEQKAYSWVNKAVDGFNAAKSRLTSAITAVVVEINRILGKIISTFQLTFGGINWPGGGGGGGGGSSGGRSTYNPNTNAGALGGRASGGSVFAGQTYMVGEMGPELFVPRGNGSIVPNNQLGQPTTARLDDSQLRMLASIIGETVIKSMNSA